jgi:hypothetical protein
VRIDQSNNDKFLLEYGRGDSFSSGVVITDKSGVAVDITDYSFSLTVDKNLNPSDISTQQFSVTGSIVDAALGKVSFSPLSTDTDLEPGTYYYDIEMIDSAGRKRTVVKSRFYVEQDLTK